MIPLNRNLTEDGSSPVASPRTDTGEGTTQFIQRQPLPANSGSAHVPNPDQNLLGETLGHVPTSPTSLSTIFGALGTLVHETANLATLPFLMLSDALFSEEDKKPETGVPSNLVYHGDPNRKFDSKEYDNTRTQTGRRYYEPNFGLSARRPPDE